jgi:hypothetical protein
MLPSMFTFFQRVLIFFPTCPHPCQFWD